jgi:cell wall-associated NlpC family hydrolase
MSSHRRCFTAALSWLLLVLTSVRAEIAPVWPDDLAPARRTLLTRALAALERNPTEPYRNGGADPAGMDCSGAVLFLLKQVGIDAPRSADAQLEWLKSAGRLTLVPTSARTLEAPAFAALQPGDLIFWAPDGPAPARASHVHLYLGREADGHAVMIGSSDGRSYRGKKLSGFGIVDFRIPQAGAPTRIIAFGTPFPATSAPPPK